MNFMEVKVKKISKLKMAFDTNQSKYSVGSLYAGIGGICRAFVKAGAEIAWANEYDAQACKTYRHNYSHTLYESDVHKLYPTRGKKRKDETIPVEPVDIIVSGFPCQAFSVAGHRKGFDDERGLHFFQTMKFFDVDAAYQPKAFLFENVKNLKNHDGGKTFEKIQEEIRKRGYSLITRIYNTMDYGNVPQTRERVYMVGFKGEANFSEGDGSASDYYLQNLPKPKKLTKRIQDLLEMKVDDSYYYNRFSIFKQLKEEVKKRDTLYQWRRVYVRENKSNVCPTLTANMGTGGHNVPLVLDAKGIRKLTPRECARFQGFKDNEFKFPKDMSISHLYKQIGNSVSVPVVQQIASRMLASLSHVKVRTDSRVPILK